LLVLTDQQRNAWFRQHPPRGYEDSQERHNRYDDPASAAERRRLHERLLDELVGTESSWPPKGWWA
jgi:hypothetical protein